MWADSEWHHLIGSNTKPISIGQPSSPTANSFDIFFPKFNFYFCVRKVDKIRFGTSPIPLPLTASRTLSAPIFEAVTWKQFTASLRMWAFG